MPDTLPPIAPPRRETVEVAVSEIMSGYSIPPVAVIPGRAPTVQEAIAAEAPNTHAQSAGRAWGTLRSLTAAAESVLELVAKHDAFAANMLRLDIRNALTVMDGEDSRLDAVIGGFGRASTLAADLARVQRKFEAGLAQAVRPAWSTAEAERRF